MIKTRKNKKRILNSALIIAMMVSLFAGILTIEVKAADNTHTHSGYTAISSSNFSSLLENIEDGGNFYLTEDITISSPVQITSGIVNLCLNGHTISFSSSVGSTSSACLFHVSNGAVFKMYDCDGDGKLTGGRGFYDSTNTNRKAGAVYIENATFEMHGGTITNCSADWGGAIFINGSTSGTFKMYGGTIENNIAEQGGGAIEVEDANSSLYIYGGSIINNNVNNVNGNLHKGGGVHFVKGYVYIEGTHGAVNITGNKVAGVENNLYLRSGKLITIPEDANLSNSSIGVSSEVSETGEEVTIASGGGAGANRCFFLDGMHSNCVMVYQGNSVSIVKSTSHSHTVVPVSEVPATCTEDGCEAHYTCSGCGNLFKDAQGKTSATAEELVINKLGHDWVQGEVSAPTINSAGITPYTCATCGDTKEDITYLSINDEKITIENADTLTYNGQVQAQKLKIYYEGELLSEDTHYTLSDNDNANAGNYTLTITGIGAFEGERTLGYVINKAPLTVTVNSEEITYGDAVPTYTVAYSGFVNSETEDALIGRLVINCNYAQYSNVGNYDITVSGYESDNYEITYVNGNVKVNPKVVGLDWSNLVFVYNGSAQLPTVALTGIVSGDTCTVTVTGEGTNAGIYIATATALSNDNYMLPATATVEFVIQKAIEADEVTSEDKDVIKEALDIIKDLLKEENAGNLTAEEKESLEQQKADLEEKLGNINAAEEKMEELNQTATSLPEANKVTSNNKAAVEEALGIINQLLAPENAGNLTAEEKATIEQQKLDLTKKLGVIQIVEDNYTILQNEKNNIPSKDVITTESKEEVVKLLDIIKDLQEKHPDNLTDEQSDIITHLKEELQEKNDRIQVIEDSLNEIENESAAMPDYDDITSDNKEDIKDIIENIENILKDENENLSSEEKEALEEQKKELEDKVTFIEQIEKYEPVSGDFENTTEPEVNDNGGDLENDSHELIELIPLEKTEKEHVAKGESVKVYLEVSDITETIIEEDKELIETEIEDNEVAIYLDINLFKQIGNREPKKVPNTMGLVTITFQVPNDLVNTDSSVTRKYKIVRVHEGEVAIIDAVYDETTGEISFETDKFSTYALIYEDVAVKAPQTGDTTATWPWLLLMFGFGMIVLSVKTESVYKSKNR